MFKKGALSETTLAEGNPGKGSSAQPYNAYLEQEQARSDRASYIRRQKLKASREKKEKEDYETRKRKAHQAALAIFEEMDDLSDYVKDSDEDRDSRLVKWIDDKFLMPISDRRDIQEELDSGVDQEDGGLDDTQIARLRFVQGYEKKDPPEGCEEMEYRI